MYPYNGYAAQPGYGYPDPYAQPYGYPPSPYAAMASPYPVIDPYAAPMIASPVLGVAAPVVAAPMMLGPNYVIQIAGRSIDCPIKDKFKASGKPSPFLAVYCTTNPYQPLTYYQQRQETIDTEYKQTFAQVDPEWLMIHKSEVIHGTQDPAWLPFTLSLQQICSGNWDAAIKFEVWSHHSTIGHDFIGGGLTTLRELQTQREVRIINKRRVGIFNSAGILQLVQFAQV